METKGRVKNGILQMRFSFDRAKTGQEFTKERGLPNYVCIYFGDGKKLLQSETPASPYVRKVGKVKHDANWNKPSNIAELVSSLYTNTDSKL